MWLARRGAWDAAAVLGAAALLAVSAMAGPGTNGEKSSPIELIMVDDPACRFCQKWNDAVGRGYAKSPEGQAAPLKRVPRGAPELEGLAPVIYTPTFIVMNGGNELGRISGYSGPSYFYDDLRSILRRADHKRGP